MDDMLMQGELLIFKQIFFKNLLDWTIWGIRNFFTLVYFSLIQTPKSMCLSESDKLKYL